MSSQKINSNRPVTSKNSAGISQKINSIVCGCSRDPSSLEEIYDRIERGVIDIGCLREWILFSREFPSSRLKTYYDFIRTYPELYAKSTSTSHDLKIEEDNIEAYIKMLSSDDMIAACERLKMVNMLMREHIPFRISNDCELTSPPYWRRAIITDGSDRDRVILLQDGHVGNFIKFDLKSSDRLNLTYVDVGGSYPDMGVLLEELHRKESINMIIFDFGPGHQGANFIEKNSSPCTVKEIKMYTARGDLQSITVSHTIGYLFGG